MISILKGCYHAIELIFHRCSINGIMILFLFKLFIFLVVLGLYCCTRAFSSFSEQGSLITVWGLQQLGLNCPVVFSCPWHVTSSGTRGQTRVPYIGRQILNQWTTREVSGQWIFKAGIFMANIYFYFLFIFN